MVVQDVMASAFALVSAAPCIELGGLSYLLGRMGFWCGRLSCGHFIDLMLAGLEYVLVRFLNTQGPIRLLA